MKKTNLNDQILNVYMGRATHLNVEHSLPFDNFEELFFAIDNPEILLYLYWTTQYIEDTGPLVHAVAQCANHCIDLCTYAAWRDAITAATNYNQDSSGFFGVEYEAILKRAESMVTLTVQALKIKNMACGSLRFVNGADWQPWEVTRNAAQAYGFSGVFQYTSPAYYKRFYEVRRAFCHIIRESLPLEMWDYEK
jgi:hypothetical protein